MPVFVLTLCGNFRHVDTDELARRLRTARAYGGFRSVEAVAEAINQQGLGVKTLRKIESGTRVAQKRDIQAIAEVCGLPPEFFTADEPFAGQPVDLEQRLEAIQLALAGQLDHERKIAEMLEEQTAILKEIRRVMSGFPDAEAIQTFNDGAQQLLDAALAGQVTPAASSEAPGETRRQTG